jgi:hypothetical protein
VRTVLGDPQSSPKLNLFDSPESDPDGGVKK